MTVHDPFTEGFDLEELADYWHTRAEEWLAGATPIDARRIVANLLAIMDDLRAESGR
jgi:hypothetical protein